MRFKFQRNVQKSAEQDIELRDLQLVGNVRCHLLNNNQPNLGQKPAAWTVTQTADVNIMVTLVTSVHSSWQKQLL